MFKLLTPVCARTLAADSVYNISSTVKKSVTWLLIYSR